VRGRLNGAMPWMVGELGSGAALKLDGDWQPGATTTSTRHREETEQGMAGVSASTQRVTHGWAFAPC
jgi:hypothetical protein